MRASAASATVSLAEPTRDGDLVHDPDRYRCGAEDRREDRRCGGTERALVGSSVEPMRGFEHPRQASFARRDLPRTLVLSLLFCHRTP